MQRDDLISVDDHIIEPHDMFVNHLPERYADDARARARAATAVKE
jgi:hypothetical protein